MVLRDGSVKVADFGIARLASAAQSTLTQEALGSVHYISPEQARGSHIDARSDLYSAGVVLYEMLTGRLPFEGDIPVSVAIQHINSIPLSPREIDPDIPEAAGGHHHEGHGPGSGAPLSLGGRHDRAIWRPSGKNPERGDLEFDAFGSAAGGAGRAHPGRSAPCRSS